jgi:nucleolar complex protein 3
MFASDAQGDASLEAVRMMSKMIKENNNDVVHPDALNTWLSLPLRVHEDEAAAARLAAAAKAKKAKKSASAKEQFDIEREMKEGDATVDRIELAKNQADTLHAVTLAYFRILKSVSSKVGADDGMSSTPSGELILLPCALRGLAKFSHLIHLDAVVDLLTVIRDLLKNASSLPPDVAINCILCALKTLRGPGRETLPVDPKEYLIPLYNILPRLGTTASITRGDMDEVVGHGGNDGVIEAAIQCLDHAFLYRRELSTSRLAAFVKRTVTASIHCPPHSSVPLLACARQISSRYSNSSSKLSRMLENEEDVVADGIFAPDAEDPEHSNAHATSFWELSLMKYAVHPAVAEQSAMMAEGRQLKLPAESPSRLLSSMCRDVKDGFVSSNGTVTWKKHPLDKGVSSNEATGVNDGSRSKRRQQRRNQDQIRFITPRRTGNWHLLPSTSWSML